MLFLIDFLCALRASAVRFPSPASHGSLESQNVKQNDFKKIYRAKTPRAQRKELFLRTWRPLPACADTQTGAFARGILIPIL
jgi:hypothetical protein